MAIPAKDLRLFVSVSEGGEWKEAAEWASDETSTHGPDTESWRRTLSLDGREVLTFAALYSAQNNSVGIEVWKDGKMLAQVLAAKFKAESYDPSLIVMTPGGTHIEVIIGAAGRR